MAPRLRDTSLGNGVYYARSDYVGFGRRTLILAVDGFILAVILFGLWLAFRIVGVPQFIFPAAAMLTAWLYLVVCKRSSWRTVGYVLTGTRIVNLKGERPSLFALTFRSLLWTFGPGVFFWDLLWSGIDEDRKTLRDCYAGTYLINERATPIGVGEIHLTYYDTGYLNPSYPHVTRPKAA
jgi:uncharacterized RDD family membrane protein YckC